MLTNQMTNEAAMAVGIIDNIKGSDVTSTKSNGNNIVISQNNRIIAQWTGETWILGTILQSVLPRYEDNCIHVINACTRLHRRAIEHRDSTLEKAGTSHSLRMIRHHMDTTGVESMDFSGSLCGTWTASVNYSLIRTTAKGSQNISDKQMYQLYKVYKPTNTITRVNYGFGTSLIGWIDLKSNEVTMGSNFMAYLKKWSLNGTKEIVKDDVIRQIAEFNNTKKR